MQKPSLEDGAPVSSRKASTSSSRSTVLDRAPDERIEGRKMLEDLSSADKCAYKTLIGDEECKTQHIAGPKTLKLKEAPSYFGSDFPDKKMPDSGVLSNKKAPTPEKFEEENQTLNLAG